jgi:ubiquinone/menaquinone biosynthesis C-methylase UbiE
LQIAGYKAKLFSQLSAEGKNILELGVGTGPNFKYYASGNGVNVIGVDPNKHMEDYARTAAVSAGLPSSSFTFKRGVCCCLFAKLTVFPYKYKNCICCTIVFRLLKLCQQRTIPWMR